MWRYIPFELWAPQVDLGDSMDFEGNVTEGSGSNFLFVSDGRIKVPDTRLVLSGADMAVIR